MVNNNNHLCFSPIRLRYFLLRPFRFARPPQLYEPNFDHLFNIFGRIFSGGLFMINKSKYLGNLFYQI